MSAKTVVRVLALVALGAIAGCMPLAAQDTTSVAEAAKRARQQKQESAKPTKVITNDEIPSAATPATVTTPAPSGAATSPGSTAGTAPAASSAPEEATISAAGSADEEARKKAEIEALEKQIHQMEHDINIQRGEVKLDEETYYSNPNRPRNAEEKDKIDREKQDLERMEADLAAALAKLSELGVSVEAKPPKPRESITSNAPPPQS